MSQLIKKLIILRLLLFILIMQPINCCPLLPPNSISMCCAATSPVAERTAAMSHAGGFVLYLAWGWCTLNVPPFVCSSIIQPMTSAKTKTNKNLTFHFLKFLQTFHALRVKATWRILQHSIAIPWFYTGGRKAK